MILQLALRYHLFADSSFADLFFLTAPSSTFFTEMDHADTDATRPSAPSTSTPAEAKPAEEAKDVPAEKAKPKTRLLKEVEAEENALIYKTLYRSLDDAKDGAIQQDFSDTSDILADARRAKAEFFRATSLPLATKAKGCGTLLNRLGEAKNKKVASVFFAVTMMMFTLPVAAVIVGMQVVAPKMHWDASLCGGFMGLGMAVAIMAGYTIYAFVEDADRVSEEQRRATQTPKPTAGTFDSDAKNAASKKKN